MATWQCDFQFILDTWLQSTYREMPEFLPDEILAEERWWQTDSLTEDYAIQLTPFAPRAKSWSHNLEMYGTEDGNCIKVLRDKGDIISVTMRVDLRQSDQQFIAGVLLFAQRQRCHLADIDGKIIAPEQNLLLTTLKESRAYRFVSDPMKYLEELKTNPIRFP